jgi:hypothetical protein
MEGAMEDPLRLVADGLRGIIACSMAGGVGWTSYLVAVRICPDAPPAVRLSATAIVAYWLQVAIFWLTSTFLLFRLPIVLPLLCVLTILTHLALAARLRVAQRLRDDASALLEFGRRLPRSVEGVLLLAVGGVALVRVLRSAVSPPLAWDDLTYHLVKAGRFVQDGGLVGVAAPGAWSYYEYFLPGGEILWAWAILPVRGDALVAPISGLIWATALLGVYTCAREYGADAPSARLTTAALCSMPATLTYIGSAYVDNTVFATFVLGALFVIRASRGAPGAESLLAMAAFAVMLGCKLNALPTIPIAVIALAWSRWRQPEGRLGYLVVGWLVAASVAVPPYVRSWLAGGSPLYPFPVRLAGRTLIDGHSVFDQYSLESLPTALRLASRREFWEFTLLRPGPGGEFNAPGPGSILLLALAAAALAKMLTSTTRAPATMATVFLLASGIATVVPILSESMRPVRETVMVMTAGRYFIPAFAAAAIVGATAPVPLVRLLGGSAIVAGSWLSLPGHWAGAEALPLVGGVALLLIVGSGVGLAVAWGRRWVASALAVVLISGAALLTLVWLRENSRYEIYAAAAGRNPVFHMHPLNPVFASAWPIWHALDDGEGHSIAVTAGWEMIGHHWYQYPLLGSRLQNRVLYVPITADGGIVDPDRVREIRNRTSGAAWLKRLLDLKVDYVVSLAPRTTIEDCWMRHSASTFEPTYADAREFHVAYRVIRTAAVGLAAEVEARCRER